MRRFTLLLLALAACTNKDDSAPITDDSAAPPVDADGDGYTADVDCADNVGAVHPDAVEVCDGLDNDCDGVTDLDAEQIATWYPDSDADGYGNGGEGVQACTAPDGYIARSGDCDDATIGVNPAAIDTCNGVDDNCDGLVDENDLQTWYRDRDGDGWGSTRSIEACLEPDGYASQTGDCDDDNALVSPDEREACNDGFDNDCDGTDNGCAERGRTVASDADAILGGALSDSYLGLAIEAVGDMTGDGREDLLIAAPYAASSGTSYDYAGRAYLVPGGFSGDHSVEDVELATVLGLSGDYLGVSLAGGLDLTGDAAPDYAVGAYYADYNGADAGAAYVFSGTATGSLAVSRASAAVYGDSYFSQFATDMVVTPDLTGDGLPDLLISDAGRIDASTNNYTGAAHLFAGPLRGTMDLTQADAVLQGQGNWAYFGYALLELGDHDGDGARDVAVGSPGISLGGAQQRGGVSVFSGPLSGTIQMSAAEASIIGGTSGDNLGISVADAGDLNLDGYADLAAAAPGTDTACLECGAVYVLLGPFSGTTSVTNASAVIYGEDSNGGFGNSLEVGNLDNDGVPDLVVGDPYTSGTSDYSGVVYGIYGPPDGSTSLDDGWLMVGETAYGYLGYRMTLADVNGDGPEDITAVELGVTYNNLSYAGRTLTFFGAGY